MIRRTMSALRRLEQSWVGDLIGAASLAVTGYVLFVVAGVLS